MRNLANMQENRWKINKTIMKHDYVDFFLDALREDMEFLEVLTEGLSRVLMVRGGGNEVITMYS